MAPFARLAQLKGRPARHNFLAKIYETGQKAPQGKLFGASTIQSQHVTAKGGLHGRVAEQLVQNHFRRGIAFQLDNHAHAIAIRFILHMRHPFNALFTHFSGNFLNHCGFVDLIGDLLNDDGPAIFAQLFKAGFGAVDHAAAALEIGFAGT